MNLWGNEEITGILRRLDEMGLPFKKCSVMQDDGSIKFLGSGGSASVYEAFTRSDRKAGYALKVIGFAGQYTDSDFFTQSVEAQREISVYNNCVVRVYDHTEIWVSFDDADNITAVRKKECKKKNGNTIKLQFILMEKVSPVVKRTMTGKTELFPENLSIGDEKEILKLACDIGSALQSAHNKKILHRDIKPENVFYSEKEKKYKLGDFGTARKTEDGFADTVVFTRGYEAPEVRSTPGNDRYDNTADIYSFGMMLYVLSNRMRFPDSDTYSVNNSVQYSTGYVLPLPDNKMISEEFYQIMVRACMYDPDQRYQSMDEMLSEIEKLVFGERIGYRIDHKADSLAAAMILMIAGAVSWKLTIASDMVFKLSTLEYCFIAAGIGKGILKFFGKKTVFPSIFMFCSGVYLLLSKGFSLWMLLIMLMMVISSGIMSGFIGFGALAASAAYVYQEYIGFTANKYCDFSWIPITLLSLAVVLFIQYEILGYKLHDEIKQLYGRDLFWLAVCAQYIIMIVIGIITADRSIFSVISGAYIPAAVCNINFTMAGLSGLGFCIFWIVRERMQQLK